MTIAGLVVSIVSGFLALVFAFATVIVGNPCGAFGDACDDYGTTPPAFFVMLALTFLAIVAFIVGLVLLIMGFSRRTVTPPPCSGAVAASPHDRSGRDPRHRRFWAGRSPRAVEIPAQRLRVHQC